MAARAGVTVGRRVPLSRERVLRAALDLADAGGLAALSMRRLARALGVEAMTIYHYVASKDELVNGIVNIVESEVELPTPGGGWKAELRRTAISYHDALTRHPWAASLALSATGERPARMRYMNAVLGALREGGFSADMTDHGYHALDSHISGFTLWAAQIPFSREELPALADQFVAGLPAGAFPYLVEHVHQHLKPRPPNDEGEFAFGLDLILDGLERLRDGGSRRHP